MPLDGELPQARETPAWSTLDDMGGGAYENDPEDVPSPADPNADAANTCEKLVVAHDRLAWAVVIEVTNTAGTMAIASVWSLRGDLTPDDFTLVENGTGDTSITHTGGKLPPRKFKPRVEQTDDEEIDRLRVIEISNGWQVKTKLGATATDCSFQLWATGV